MAQARTEVASGYELQVVKALVWTVSSGITSSGGAGSIGSDYGDLVL